jgi:hypothetical protein
LAGGTAIPLKEKGLFLIYPASLDQPSASAEWHQDELRCAAWRLGPQKVRAKP